MMHGSLPHKLRVLRARQGQTLIGAAKMLGIGRETLADLEKGLRQPTMPTLHKIAQGYGVDVEELLEEPVLAGKAEAPPETGQAPLEDDEQAATSRFLTLDADLLRTICESMAAHYENLAGRDVPPSRALGWWDVAPYDAAFVLAVVDVVLEGVQDGSIIDDENELIGLLRAAYRLAHFADALWSKSVEALGEEIERASVEMRFWQATERVELTEEQKEAIVS
jgi:transcriptional regulator with XRE-family HTH domain